MHRDDRGRFVEPPKPSAIRVFCYPFRLVTRSVFFVFGRFSMMLIIVAAMLLLNVATLTATGVATAAGSLLARAGLTTVAETNATKLARAEARLASQAADLRFVERRLASQSAELITAKRTVARQSDALASANRQVARQADELIALRHVRYDGSRRAVGDAVATFADRVSRRTATATARNLAAIPAEAIPLFGVAVIVGATAWELNDACELMRDVHELNVAFNPSLANDPEHLEACGLEVPTQEEIWERVVREPEKALDEQPDDYQNVPRFEEPSWWDWTMSLLGRQTEAVSAPITP